MAVAVIVCAVWLGWCVVARVWAAWLVYCSAIVDCVAGAARVWAAWLVYCSASVDCVAGAARVWAAWFRSLVHYGESKCELRGLAGAARASVGRVAWLVHCSEIVGCVADAARLWAAWLASVRIAARVWTAWVLQRACGLRDLAGALRRERV